MSQGQGQGWELVAERLGGCLETVGFVTHRVTGRALAFIPPHHLRHSSLPSPEPSSHLLHTSLFFSHLMRTKADSIRVEFGGRGATEPDMTESLKYVTLCSTRYRKAGVLTVGAVLFPRMLIP